MTDRGFWAILGAILGAAIGAIILVMPLGDFDLIRRNLPLLVGDPPLLLFIIGLPATQGILVGVAVRHFYADMQKGAGLGFMIGILYGVIYVIVIIVSLAGSATCDQPNGSRLIGSQDEGWCELIIFGLIFLGSLFLVVAGTGTGLMVSWVYSRRRPLILY